MAGALTVLVVKSLNRCKRAICPLSSIQHGPPFCTIRRNLDILSRPGFGISVAGLKYQIYPYYILTTTGQYCAVLYMEIFSASSILNQPSLSRLATANMTLSVSRSASLKF